MTATTKPIANTFTPTTTTTETPINGQWSDFSTLTACQTCGPTEKIGTQTRRRTCTNPKPQFGGLGCKVRGGDVVVVNGILTETETRSCQCKIPQRELIRLSISNFDISVSSKNFCSGRVNDFN